MKYFKIGIISIIVIISVLILLDKSNKISEQEKLTNNTNIQKEEYKKETSNANSPLIKSNGLIPIVYEEDGKINENFKMEEWYSYTKENKKWANAITKDENSNITGYYVWIPRFAYKIIYNNENDKSLGGKIDIKFLIGNSDQYVDDDGKVKSAAHTKEKNEEKNNDYVVHPSFIADTQNGYKNNGWSSEIEGFWISKYPATYQQTSINDKSITDEKRNKIVYTNNSYSIVADENNQYFDEDNIYGKITNKTKISYPTFMPLSVIYTKINIGDATNLSKQIAKDNNFYNLKNMDSHLVKISEWSAVAYLTQSEYGHGNNMKINNYFSLDEMYDSIQVNRISGISQSKKSEDLFNIANENINDMSYYNTEDGKKASSTGNIYGIYDIAGGVNEFLACYIKNNNKNIEKNGNANGKYKFFNENNTRYITNYPFNNEKDTIKLNLEEYLNSGNYYGDSIKEMTNERMETWGAYLNYPYRESAFFCKSGAPFINVNFGLFAISRTKGEISENDGFRVCLINN